MPDSDNIKRQFTDPFDDLNFNRLFAELYTPLCLYSMKFVNDISAAEDIVQDQFVYIWEKGKNLSEYISVRSYLYKAVKNRSINCVKKSLKDKSLKFTGNQQENEIAASLNDPAEMLENEEIDIIINKALQSLPKKCRTIFLMRRQSEMSNKEIASELDISVKTVEAQMTIAIKKLTSFISEHWELVFVLLINHLQKFL